MQHWRPIQLGLIEVEALSLTLQPFLDELIHPMQTGFIKDRSILDNIFTLSKSLIGQIVGRGDRYLTLEKANDQVDWGLLEGTLLRMGIHS